MQGEKSCHAIKVGSICLNTIFHIYFFVVGKITSLLVSQHTKTSPLTPRNDQQHRMPLCHELLTFLFLAIAFLHDLNFFLFTVYHSYFNHFSYPISICMCVKKETSCNFKFTLIKSSILFSTPRTSLFYFYLRRCFICSPLVLLYSFSLILLQPTKQLIKTNKNI